MRSFRTITLVEAKLTARNFYPMFFGLVFPVMLLVTFGSIYGNKPSYVYGGQGTVNASLPAYCVMVVAVTGLMNLPLTMAEYRDRLFLRRLRATPVRPAEYLTAHMVVNAVTTLVGIALLLLVGVTAFHLQLTSHGLLFVGVLLLVMASVYSLGMLIAAVAPNERAATVIANLVYFPMIFLTGATIPLRLLPSGMRHVADALPLTYGVRLLTRAWTGSAPGAVWLDVTVLVGVLLVATAASVRWFRWE